jgi:hypothetical protein
MAAKAPDPDDVVLLHSPTEDGGGVRVVRAREGQVEVGEVRPLAEGKPITGEVVTLTPRPDTPRVCDVCVQHSSPRPKKMPPKAGPAQVATDAYRDHWEATFGRKRAAMN